jgi:hypothetical protein
MFISIYLGKITHKKLRNILMKSTEGKQET